MFDLNHEITEWKQSLGQSETVTRPDLDELESHLRDQIDHLSMSGLSIEEALLVARHRIGDTKRLSGEFAKVNGSAIFRRRLQWMLIGVLAYLLIFDLSHLASLAGTLAAFGIGFHGSASGWIGQGAQFLSVLIGLVVVLVVLRIPGMSRLTASVGGGIGLGLIVIVGSLLLIAARILLPILTIRFVSAQDYGQSAVVQSLSALVYSGIIPILVVTLLVLLRKPSLQQEIGVH